MSRTVRIISVLIAGFSLSVYFVNCAGGLPDLNSTVNTSSKGEFSVAVSPAQVSAGEMAQIFIENGSTPFTYKITSGTATIDANGKISGTVAGSVVIQITDSAGHEAFATLSVLSSTGGAVVSQSCTTPWGTVIAHGATASGFASSRVECPATCVPAAVSCVNGVLFGTAKSASCLVANCVYKQIPFSGACATKSSPYLSAVPPTCAASAYHTSICVATATINEYMCVSPSE